MNHKRGVCKADAEYLEVLHKKVHYFGSKNLKGKTQIIQPRTIVQIPKRSQRITIKNSPFVPPQDGIKLNVAPLYVIIDGEEQEDARLGKIQRNEKSTNKHDMSNELNDNLSEAQTSSKTTHQGKQATNTNGGKKVYSKLYISASHFNSYPSFKFKFFYLSKPRNMQILSSSVCDFCNKNTRLHLKIL